MKNFLDDSERQRLLSQHKKERDKRVCDRIKAVLLYDKGWTYQRIAEALLISHEGIRQHVLDYEVARKLSPQNGGSSSKLNEPQKQMLIEHIREAIYTKAKDIAAFVLKEFGVLYSVSGMTQWIKKKGFSYKKPAVVPGKANKKAQEEWIQEYNETKENLPENEAICFVDGVHPTHNTKPSYGWIETGTHKEIPTNTGRQRLNLSGAIDIETKRVISHEDQTLDADSTIRFLDKIELAYPEKEKVHIFCDNARYYRNKKVQAYLEESKISMHFLPPYSPNLNPIERLWKLLNEEVINNKYYEKFSGFKENVLGFLKNLNDPPERILRVLKNRITDNFRAMGSVDFFNSST
ncbi:IS630 family transposase [Chlamydiales bacterium]|nr:IS630 family transposase [Chlamydiales bacterium]